MGGKGVQGRITETFEFGLSCHARGERCHSVREIGCGRQHPNSGTRLCRVWKLLVLEPLAYIGRQTEPHSLWYRKSGRSLYFMDISFCCCVIQGMGDRQHKTRRLSRQPHRWREVNIITPAGPPPPPVQQQPGKMPKADVRRVRTVCPRAVYTYGGGGVMKMFQFPFNWWGSLLFAVERVE